ncbi:GNAT family N-acetyltransferase [Streptomyces sp. Ag109_G2-15]|uniref:GNAT family N-acetyltransferase n=1 Tax=Streptomyces sp. Ag109_G2-15 TaxID=1938850 RepID=UPI000BD3A5BA|nr:GNAT family N-acetyltransferase [Streptomyces sp. Ag109_G2-15]SOD86909.1 Protein N-acetyltransferase, RimJ/RimL family [Streptomyces sp. Ag109_G2-15]
MPTARLEVAATPTGPALLLRPWCPADAAALVEAYRDDALRRWTSGVVEGEAGAARWIREQARGWEERRRFSFAVVESGPGPERVLGHAVLKFAEAPGDSAEVGYWTAAPARGRGVAPRALDALSDWAFAAFGGDGLTRLELLHQADNAASCRVARKCGYELTGLLPAAPPAYPRDGHVHVRENGRSREAVAP